MTSVIKCSVLRGHTGVQVWQGKTTRYAHILRCRRERTEPERKHTATHLRRRRSSQLIRPALLRKRPVVVNSQFVFKSTRSLSTRFQG